MWRRFPFLLTAALALHSLTACGRAPATVPVPVAAAAPAPARISALAAGDGLAALREQTRGKVTLVTFWATWCDACEDELPSLRRLAARAPQYGGEVVGVDVGDRAEEVVRFTARHRVAYRQLLDEDFGLLDALGGERRIPRTLVLDATGEIVYQGASFDPHALAVFRSTLSAGSGTGSAGMPSDAR